MQCMRNSRMRNTECFFQLLYALREFHKFDAKLGGQIPGRSEE
jgi:hypothetical protein